MSKLEKQWRTVKSTYKLEQILGSGSFGQVVKAKNRQTKQPCAIKCVQFNKSQLTSLKYIIREIQILKKLTQMEENIYTTKLIDVILEEAQENIDIMHIFFVMDLHTCNMKQALLANSVVQMSEDHVLFIVYNVLCAVNFLHSAGVVHRDLKPQNILIEEDCTIKLCDFGISRTLLQMDTHQNFDSESSYLSQRLKHL